VKRVATISGVGCRIATKAGPVTATFAKDAEIERTGRDLPALWRPGFMENAMRAIPFLKQHGEFSNLGSPDLKAPFVAPRHIAASGVGLLLERPWTSGAGVAVLGPEDLSFDDMAATMTDVLGKPIRFLSMTDEDYTAQLMKIGASETFAQGLVEMRTTRDCWLELTEPRTTENTTPATFRQCCEEVLRPAKPLLRPIAAFGANSDCRVPNSCPTVNPSLTHSGDLQLQESSIAFPLAARQRL